MSEIEEFMEWRVTGKPGPGYPTYDFTFSPERGDADPEQDARGFVALATRSGPHPWVDGPHLHCRVVSRTAWTDVADFE